MAEDKAIEAAAEAIIDDLTDRKGFRGLIDNLDEEVLTELRDSVASAAVIAYLRAWEPDKDMVRHLFVASPDRFCESTKAVARAEADRLEKERDRG